VPSAGQTAALATTAAAGPPTASPPTAGPDGWEAIPGADEALYTPGPDDEGWLLRCEVTPGSVASGGGPGPLLGTPAAADAALPVSPGPPTGPGGGRHAHTPTLTRAPHLRVLTYNLLADQYASSDYAKAHLFAHCHPHFLDPAYRRALAAAELVGYRADVLCLQEVDERAFTLVLGPVLRAAGYAGAYTNKASSVREGCATFWRADRWAVAARRDVAMKDVFAALAVAEGLDSVDGAVSPSPSFRPPDAPADRGACLALAARHAALAPALRSCSHLRAALAQVSTIGQVTLLVPRKKGGVTADASTAPDGPLLVANTHLFFHPRAPHIRSLHVAALVAEAWDVAARAASGVAEPEPVGDLLAGEPGEAVCDAEACRADGSDPAAQPALLLAGDLNSDLNDGIPGTVELLREGRLPAGWWDWAYGAGFRYEADGVDSPAATAAAAAAAAGARAPAGEGPRDSPPSPTAPGLPPPPPSSSTFTPPDLVLPLRLRPADGLATPFTNYVRGYKGLLDYVWSDPSKLGPAAWVPLPPAASLPDFLPSQAWPSDHLAVVVDLEWRPRGVRGGAPPPGGGLLPPEWRWRAPVGLEVGAEGAGAGPDSDEDDVRPPPPLAPPGQVVTVDDSDDAPSAAAAAAAAAAVSTAILALRRGEVVALPTDTLYGLAADACCASALRRLYGTKGRAARVPLAVAVGAVADVGRLARTDGLPPGLLGALLPGPVTVILTRLPRAPLAPGLNPGVATIGVRVPASSFIRAVASAHGGALALTSANVSGAPSSVAVGEFRPLWPACAKVFDGGLLGEDRAGSTVLDLSGVGDGRAATYSILRAGGGAGRVRDVLAEFGLRELV